MSVCVHVCVCVHTRKKIEVACVCVHVCVCVCVHVYEHTHTHTQEKERGREVTLLQKVCERSDLVTKRVPFSLSIPLAPYVHEFHSSWSCCAGFADPVCH